jgi:hypothetical protein
MLSVGNRSNELNTQFGLEKGEPRKPGEKDEFFQSVYLRTSGHLPDND